MSGDERQRMHKMRCPTCGKEIELISFGGAWVGMCNFEIVYDSYKLPEDCREEEGHSLSDEEPPPHVFRKGAIRHNSGQGMN